MTVCEDMRRQSRKWSEVSSCVTVPKRNLVSPRAGFGGSGGRSDMTSSSSSSSSPKPTHRICFQALGEVMLVDLTEPTEWLRRRLKALCGGDYSPTVLGGVFGGGRDNLWTTLFLSIQSALL